MSVAKDKLRKRIFLVDDHPLVREWLTNLINQQIDLTVCGESEWVKTFLVRGQIPNGEEIQ